MELIVNGCTWFTSRLPFDVDESSPSDCNMFLSDNLFSNLILILLRVVQQQKSLVNIRLNITRSVNGVLTWMPVKINRGYVLTFDQ